MKEADTVMEQAETEANKAVEANPTTNIEAQEETQSKVQRLKKTISGKVNATYENTLKPTYDKVAPVVHDEWMLFKAGMGHEYKTRIRPGVSSAYQDIAKPILKTTLDVTFQELGYASSAIQQGYKNYIVPGLKSTYGDTLKPIINAGAKPAERFFPQTTAQIKDKFETGVTDPVRTAKSVAAYIGATGVLSYRAVIWTAEAFFTVLKAPYSGYRKYREWEPKNETLNKVKNVADLPFDALDAVVSPVANGIKTAYNKYNYAFKSVPYPLSVGVFALGGLVIGYTTLKATKYLLDAGAGELSDSAPKVDIMSLEGLYQFAAPKLSKVALFKPMVITFKTSKEGFFKSDLYNNNLKPMYLEIVDPVVQEAKEILTDVDHRVDEIAPIWQRTTDTVNSIAFPTEEQKLEGRKERAKAVENIKWYASRVVAPAAIVAAPALAYVDRSISIPFAVAVTAGLTVIQTKRWEKNNVQERVDAKVEDKFAEAAKEAAANDNPDVANDIAPKPIETSAGESDKKTMEAPSI